MVTLVDKLSATNLIAPFYINAQCSWDDTCLTINGGNVKNGQMVWANGDWCTITSITIIVRRVIRNASYQNSILTLKIYNATTSDPSTATLYEVFSQELNPSNTTQQAIELTFDSPINVNGVDYIFIELKENYIPNIDDTNPVEYGIWVGSNFYPEGKLYQQSSVGASWTDIDSLISPKSIDMSFKLSGTTTPCGGGQCDASGPGFYLGNSIFTCGPSNCAECMIVCNNTPNVCCLTFAGPDFTQYNLYKHFNAVDAMVELTISLYYWSNGAWTFHDSFGWTFGGQCFMTGSINFTGWNGNYTMKSHLKARYYVSPSWDEEILETDIYWNIVVPIPGCGGDSSIIYVDCVNGSNSNTGMGSFQCAVKTITKAHTLVANNGTIFIKYGDCTSEILSNVLNPIQNNIKLMPVQSETVVGTGTLYINGT